MKTRLLSFSIRDQLWLLLVVACLSAWWAERRAAAQWEKDCGEAVGREIVLGRKYDVLEDQFNHLQLKLAQGGYRWHFDIYQYPDGKSEVRSSTRAGSVSSLD